MSKGYVQQGARGTKDNEKQLFEVADSQQGFFTAKQAVEAGYSEKNHAFHVRSGNWIRELHGVYRLSAYPQSPEADFVLWSLWSRGKDGVPQGVYSHETVLSHFELSDVNPARLHLTVPKAFKRNTKTPAQLVLHRAGLENSEIRVMHGFRMTSVKRALEDVIREGTLSQDLIVQAVRDALKKGNLLIVELEDSELLRPYKTLIRKTAS